MSWDSHSFDVEEEYEEGDEWIFSYADLMSLMVGFFVIMFLFSGPEVEKNQELADDIAESFRKEQKAVLPIDVLESRNKVYENLLEILGVPETEYEAANKTIRSIYQSLDSNQDLASSLQKSFVSYSDFMKVFNEKRKPLRIIIPSKNIFLADQNIRVDPHSAKNLRDIGIRIAQIRRYKTIVIEAYAPSFSTPSSQVFEITAIQASRVAEILFQSGIPREHLRVSGMGVVDSVGSPGAGNGKNGLDEAHNGRIEILVF